MIFEWILCVVLTIFTIGILTFILLLAADAYVEACKAIWKMLIKTECRLGWHRFYHNWLSKVYESMFYGLGTFDTVMEVLTILFWPIIIPIWCLCAFIYTVEWVKNNNKDIDSQGYEREDYNRPPEKRKSK